MPVPKLHHSMGEPKAHRTPSKAAYRMLPSALTCTATAIAGRESYHERTQNDLSPSLATVSIVLIMSQGNPLAIALQGAAERSSAAFRHGYFDAALIRVRPECDKAALDACDVTVWHQQCFVTLRAFLEDCCMLQSTMPILPGLTFSSLALIYRAPVVCRSRRGTWGASSRNCGGRRRRWATPQRSPLCSSNRQSMRSRASPLAAAACSASRTGPTLPVARKAGQSGSGSDRTRRDIRIRS